MKATKFLLLLWALALGSMAGWSQSVTQPTLQLSNPSGTDATDVAVCPGGGNVTLNWSATDATVVRLELRAGTETGPLVTTFYPAGTGTGATDASDGIFEPLTAGTLGSPATVALPALNVGTKYFLLVIAYKTVGMVTTSDSKWVTLAPAALPTTPAFTLTPSTVCVQPGNAAVATAVSPDTDKFGYTWSLVEGAPSTVSTFTPSTGVTTTVTPTAVGTANITLTAAYRSMSCGTTSTTQTLTTVTAVVPKINSTPGAVAGITVDSPVIFNPNTPPYATFPTVPTATYEVCEGTPITLSVYCIPGQTAVWSRNNVQIGVGSPITVTPVSGGMDPNYNEYTYTAKCKLDGSQNCESEGRSITVKTIRQTSLVPTPAPSATSECQTFVGPPAFMPNTKVVTTTANCPAGSIAQWYDAVSGGSALPLSAVVGSEVTTTSRTITIDLTTSGAITKYVTCKQGLCESSTRTAYTFTVVPKPGAPTITNTNGDFACANTAAGAIPGPTSLILTALCAPGTTANWYQVSTTSPGLVVVPPTGDPNVGIVGTGGSYTHASAAGATVYQVRCKDNTSGCWSELSAPRTITINPVATAPTGTFSWTGNNAPQICVSNTPVSPNLASLTCATGTVKWYNADGTAVISAPSSLDISGAANPGPNPDGTLVRTYTYQVACEDATADPALVNTCESPKRTVSITVVRAPAAPTTILNTTGNPIASSEVVCQGANNSTFITSNCPTLPGWQTEWQIVGTLFTQGSGNHWTTNAPQTGDAGANNDNNILYVNASNFDPTFTTAAAGWTISARCHNGNIPGTNANPSICQDGAITTVTGVKVNVKENPQDFYMQSAPSDAPLANIIPNGKNLCLGSTVKLNQVEPLLPGGICSGVIQWQRRFRATITETWPAWGDAILGQQSPFTDAPLTVAGQYEYRIRCNGLCPGDWSNPQSVIVSATPTPGFTATPAATTCVEPTTGTATISLALSGCDASNSNLAPVNSQLYRVTRTMTEEGVVGSVTTSFDVPASVLGVTTPNPYTVTIDPSTLNSRTRTYVYSVTCVRVYGSGQASSGECTGTAVTQTVTIRTKPAPPTALAVNATPICVGGTATLTGTCAEGTIEWDQITNVITAGTPKTFTGSPFVITNVPSSVSYRARCVVDGCNGNYAAQQVSVSVVVPAKPVLSQTTPVLCPTPSITPSVKTTTLTATGCSGAQETLVWSSATPGVTIPDTDGQGSGSNYALVVTTGTPGAGDASISSNGGNFVFRATCTRPGGCPSFEDITVSVLNDPGLSITKAPATDPVCAGTAVTLTATSVLSPIGGWSWTGSGDLVTPGNQNNPSITTPGAGATASMTGTYNLTANYQSCVFKAAPVTLTVVTSIAAPTAISGPAADQCNAISATANLSTTCTTPGSTPLWSTGATTTTIAAPVPLTGSATYSVKCVLSTCESSSVSFTINTKPFQVSIVDIKGSGSTFKPGASSLADWKLVYPYDATTYAGATHQGQLDLDKTTAVNRLVLQNYKTPRFWTLEVKLCAPDPAVKSLTFRVDKLNAQDNVDAQFYTTESFAPYFMFGNGGNTLYDELYTINHPYFGFYNGGLYDAGFPKGKYNIKIDAWSVDGVTPNGTSNVQKIAPWNPLHPNQQVVPLLSRTYYVDVTTTDGSAREGVSEAETFAVVTPNPVTRTLTLSINGAKGQEVKLNLVDAAGRSLMTRSVTPESNSHREEVDMSNNKTGMYFMQVTSPLKNAALKVLKVSQD